MDWPISSNSLPFITQAQMINNDFFMWRDPNKQKYLWGTNLSGNRIINSFVRAKIGWSAVSTGIWPGFKVWIVFDMIFIQWYCISKVWMVLWIDGKMADMSGSYTTDQCFPVWRLAQGTK